MTANSRLISPFDVLNNYAINSDGTTRHEEVFGSNDFALEPCNNNSSHQRLRNQMHIIIQTISNPNATCHQRKRKLDQYMNGHKFATTLGLITRGKCDDQNDLLNEKVDYCGICRHDSTHLGDLDEFIETPNPIQQGYFKNYPKDLVTIGNYINSTERSIKEKSAMEFSKTSNQSLVNGNFDNSRETSHSSISEKEVIELNLAQNNLSSEDYDIQRPVIPIGPNFQAEVPKWEGPTNIRHQDSDADLKWLGIQLWPMHDISKNSKKVIGEGRHDSCSCEFPRSIDCAKLHVSEARELLKLEIGTTFSSWKFDEMGEDVSKSWTLEEQEEFESLVKLNWLSKGTNLSKLAMEHFLSKSMKCMINYYHNVYIPRRLSRETRSCYDVVDSDNEQDENLNNKNDYSSAGRSWLSIFHRQGV